LLEFDLNYSAISHPGVHNVRQMYVYLKLLQLEYRWYATVWDKHEA